LAGLVVGVVLAGGVAYLLRHILYGLHTIALPQDQPHHIALLRAKRHPDSDLPACAA
jgi:hypothetical protein